jgi:hypothetical protein
VVPWCRVRFRISWLPSSRQPTRAESTRGKNGVRRHSAGIADLADVPSPSHGLRSRQAGHMGCPHHCRRLYLDNDASENCRLGVNANALSANAQVRQPKLSKSRLRGLEPRISGVCSREALLRFGDQPSGFVNTTPSGRTHALRRPGESPSQGRPEQLPSTSSGLDRQKGWRADHFYGFG